MMPRNVTQARTLANHQISQRNFAADVMEHLQTGSTQKEAKYRWNILNIYPQFKSFLV